MSKRILIITEDKKLLEVAKRYFEKEGYEMATIFDSDRILDIVQDVKPDLLVLDVKLSKVDKLKQVIFEEITTPVLVLIDKDRKRDEDITRSLKVTSYLTKPFNMTKFIDRIKDILHKSEVIGSGSTDNEIITINDIQINTICNKVTSMVRY